MFVDMHHHIVYGVDDGPQTPEDAQRMLVAAAQDGTEILVATSHISPGQVEFPYQKYADHLREEQAWCDANGLNIQILSGAEIFYTENTVRMLRDGYVPTLAGTKALLVEFSPDSTWKWIEDAVGGLTKAGYRVAVAHIERYRCMRDIRHVQTLRDEWNAMMQVNAHTLYTRQGLMTDHWLKKLHELRLIDLVATDAHNASSRRTCMTEAFEALCQAGGEPYAIALMVDHPCDLLGIE